MKNANVSLKALFASLLLAASGAAFAQETPPPFEEVDTNGDGAISSRELAAANVDINMEDADTNGDGMLDRSEYLAAVSDL